VFVTNFNIVAEFIIKTNDKESVKEQITSAFNKDKDLIQDLRFLTRELYMTQDELYSGNVKYEGNIELDDLLELTANHISIQIPYHLKMTFDDLTSPIDIIPGERDSFFIFVSKEIQYKYNRKGVFTQIMGLPKNIYPILKSKVEAYDKRNQEFQEKQEREKREQKARELEERNKTIDIIKYNIKELEDQIIQLRNTIEKVSSGQISTLEAQNSLADILYSE